MLTNGLQLVTKRLWNFLHTYRELGLRGDEGELGEHLQKLREEKKMSREEVAGAMNVSRQAVYKWGNNKGILILRTFYK